MGKLAENDRPDQNDKVPYERSPTKIRLPHDDFAR